jgi:hypothetical protein
MSRKFVISNKVIFGMRTGESKVKECGEEKERNIEHKTKRKITGIEDVVRTRKEQGKRGSKPFWGVGQFLLDYTAQHPSIQSSSDLVLEYSMVHVLKSAAQD